MVLAVLAGLPGSLLAVQAPEPPQDPEQPQAEQQAQQQGQQGPQQQPREQTQQQPQQQAQQAPRGTQTGAPSGADCGALPGHEELTSLLRQIVAPGDKTVNGGLGNHVWATIVNRQGVVCSLTRSGEASGDQWPGSRAIAASKAYTANGFSLENFALSTANLYWPAQPSNSLYGLEASHPPDVAAVHAGNATNWGTADDPAIGKRLGGTIVFGGGLALYDSNGELLGGLGVSGDQSCTDHVIAWKLRHELNLDNVPDGASKQGDDNIIYDLSVDPGTGRQSSASGYGHPTCSPTAQTIARNFEQSAPTGPEE